MHLRPRVFAAAVALCAALTTPGTGLAATNHRVMVLGDSISQGAAGDTTWRARLWQSLQASPAAGTVDLVGSRRGLFNYAAGTQDGGTAYADPAFDQDHEALWGVRLAAVTSTVASTLSAAPVKPTTIIVALGTNDFSSGASAATTNMQRLIQNARAAVPGVDLVLVPPYAVWDQKYKTFPNRDYYTSLASSLGSLAAQLDTPAERVVAAPLTDFDARTQSWDGRHPNATGELVIASAVARSLATIGIGDGPHLPASATWAATAAAPSVTVSGQRATVSWTDATPGALDYAVEQRARTAAGAVGAFTRVALLARATTTWQSPVLASGTTHEFRIVPVRRAMAGTPGPFSSVTIAGGAPAPAPTPRPRPWWQWW